MIGYSITLKDLKAAIEAESPGWLQNARDRTDGFKQLGYYEEASTIWSKIKPVYMRLQGNAKCVFCERKLEAIELGTVEQDVEHYRPKGSVKAWKLPTSLKQAGVVLTPAPPKGKGYYLLPYHPFNYAASCKPCNSVLKRDYFPIAGAYDLDGSNPEKMKKEKPYLLYPFGDLDDSPEALIQFLGISPHAVPKSGHARQRALVTIEFFKLDDVASRKNLFRDRARVIVAMFPQLERMTDANLTTAQRKRAKDLITGFTADYSEHANCARCFRKLFEDNLALAQEIFDQASTLILSSS